MHANNGSMREEDREKEISSMFSGVTLAPNIQKHASHRIDNSANVPLAPPRVTSSMLASANPTPNPTSTTKESRQKTARKDKIETTNGISFQNEEGKHNDPTETIASIPDIEELQVHGDELPITPQMTQELYDCMHPILPTIQELDAALEKAHKKHGSKGKSIGKNIAASWSRGSFMNENVLSSSPAPMFQGKVDERWFVDTLSYEANRGRDL